MGSILEQRRRDSEARLRSLAPDLQKAGALASNKACVYITGSFARGDASPHSDLDLFIVGKTTVEGGKIKRLLSSLDEVCIKADLIEMTRNRSFPEFSGDGQYLVHYTVDELVSSLGSRDDDSQNTFTARLLLLLESQPLIGEDVYRAVISETIDSYWRDYPGHEGQFSPAFLCNDVLRLWRTFCVNYEARTKTAPDQERAKRQLIRHKLKHSRLLTCYSAILYLMDTYNSKGTVTKEDAEEMVCLAPTQRIEVIQRKHPGSATEAVLKELVETYEQFLSDTGAPERVLIEKILGDKEYKGRMSATENKLGQQMFNALKELGGESQLYRMLVV